MQRMLEIFATIMNCPLLGLPYNFIIHKLLAVFITFLNLLKAFDSSDIHYIRKLTINLMLILKTGYEINSSIKKCNH